MEKINTWQMIKELMENPKKEFVGKDRRAYVTNGIIVIGDISTASLKCQIEPKRLWEEYIEPVDFITAVKSGKKIRVEHPEFYTSDVNMLNSYSDLDDVAIKLGESYVGEEIKDIILNGKWYIEDKGSEKR